MLHYAGNMRARRTRCVRLIDDFMGVKREHTTSAKGSVTCPQCRKPDLHAGPEGEHVPATEIKQGDKVVLPGCSDGEPREVRAVDVWGARWIHVYMAGMSGYMPVFCEAPVFRATVPGWWNKGVLIAAQDVKVGDVILANGAPFAVKSIEPEDTTGRVYISNGYDEPAFWASEVVTVAR